MNVRYREKKGRKKEKKGKENKMRESEKMRRFRILELEKQGELKIKKMEAASRLTKENSTNANAKQQGASPKLPYFDETIDDMDSYLRWFECFARAQNWDTSDYATNLSALLREKSLDVYTRLSPEHARNYDELKKALLKHYLLTEEGFKDKFETSNIEKGETATQFAARLTKYFDRWVDLTGTGKTYHDLRELIIKERFLALLPREVTTYLREQENLSLENCAKGADRYLDAHHLKTGTSVVGNKQKQYPWKGNQKPKQNEIQDKKERKKINQKLTCFICNEVGHKAVDCRLKQKINASASAFMNRSPVDGEESSQTSCKWPSVAEKCTGCEQSYVNFTVNMVDRDRKFLPVKMGTVNGKIKC